ncbi:MAG: sporulation protein YabP [Tenericutes bacterium]|nr:sporulation protein YabP [Mycoplasmatota bacterium]
MEESFKIENQNITISNRSSACISGIKKILSFDEEEFNLDTTSGQLEIKGEGLEIIKLDIVEGTINIKGIINSFDYLDSISDKKQNGMLSRLFK